MLSCGIEYMNRQRCVTFLDEKQNYEQFTISSFSHLIVFPVFATTSNMVFCEQRDLLQ